VIQSIGVQTFAYLGITFLLTAEVTGFFMQNPPEGNRHLAHLHIRIGYTVKKDMPQSEGPELGALYRSGNVWLQGGSSPIRKG